MATVTLKIDVTDAIEQLKAADGLIKQLVAERQEIRAYADGLEEWILKNERKLEDLQDEILRLRNGAIQQDKKINESHKLRQANITLCRELNNISALLGLEHMAIRLRGPGEPATPRESAIQMMRANLESWEGVRRYVEQQLGRGGLNAEHLVDLFAAKDDQIQKLKKQAAIDGAEIARLQTGTLVSEVRDLRQCLEFAYVDVKALEGVKGENINLRGELAKAKRTIDELGALLDKKAATLGDLTKERDKLIDAVRIGASIAKRLSDDFSVNSVRTNAADLREVMQRALKC